MKTLRKEVHQEAAAFQEGKIKDRARITLKGNCTNPSCHYWHPPVCQNYISESGCKFGEKCVFRHTEVDSQPSRKSKKSCGQGSVASLKQSNTCGLRFPGHRASQNPSRFFGRSQSLWNQIAPSEIPPHIWALLQKSKKKAPSWAYLFGHNGPLWEDWELNFETWVRGNGLFFLGLVPLWGQKKSKFEMYEHQTNTQRINRKCILRTARLCKNVFLA